MILLVLTAVIFLGGCGTVLADGEPIIGRSFYVPKINLLTEQLTGGFPIFKDLPPSCIKVGNKDGQIGDNSVFLQDTATFYHSLSTSTSISADLLSDFTLGLTLDATTNSISGGSRTIRGFTLNTYSTASQDYIEPECINNEPLADELVAAFQRLPSQIKSPWLLSSWVDYQGFLLKYSSHFVTQVTYGSSIYQHCFSDSSNSYTEREYTVKVCGDFAGVTLEGIAVAKACEGVTQNDINKVSNLATSKQTVLRGGTLKTRSELYKNRSPEIIAKFLSEANQSHTPIQYKLMPIWTVLKNRYLGTEHMGKVVNLEQYYKGYLNFECNHMETSNGVELQRFVAHPDSSPSFPLYICEIAPIGCQDDGDCHYRDAFWCECKGDSCVNYRIEKSDAGVERTIPFIHTESGGWWQGCSFVAFSGCLCNGRNTNWVTVWDGSHTDEWQLTQLMHKKLMGSVKP